MEREMDFREYQEWIIFLNSRHDLESGRAPNSTGSDWQSQLNFMRFIGLRQQAGRK